MCSLFCKRIVLVHTRKESVHTCSFFLQPLSASASKEDLSFTASFLVENCGLSSKAAISVSKKIQIKNTKQTGKVLQILEDYGFSKEQIGTAITRSPRLLGLQPEKILKPKLEYFRSAGFTDLEITKLLSKTPILLNESLERKIMPSVSFLKTILPSNNFIINFLSRVAKFIMPNHVQNIAILRVHGVPESAIMKMIMSHSRSMARDVARFAEAVENVKEFGVDPKRVVFVHAVGVVSYMSRSTWERKVALYRNLGWTDNDLFFMLRQQPRCFALSDELIEKKVNFFKKKLGWDSTLLASRLTIMQMSLENRIIPRCSVVSLLMSKGLMERKTKSTMWFNDSDKMFLEKYVEKYKNEVPEVVAAYSGKIAFEGWV